MKLGKLINYLDEVGFTQGLEIKQPYIAYNNLSEGYEDISSIVNWDKYGNQTTKDTKSVRDEIRKLVEEKIGNDYSNFNLLTDEEKKIACKWLVNRVGILNFATTITDENERQIIIENFDNTSIVCREQRYKALRQFVLTRIDRSNALEILNDAQSDSLVQKYIGGIEGVEMGDPVGIFDFIRATSGTTYEDSGFAVRNIVPVDGSSLSEIIEKCMDILKNGNY